MKSKTERTVIDLLDYFLVTEALLPEGELIVEHMVAQEKAMQIHKIGEPLLEQLRELLMEQLGEQRVQNLGKQILEQEKRKQKKRLVELKSFLSSRIRKETGLRGLIKNGKIKIVKR